MGHVWEFIRDFYPEYYTTGISYPASQCAPIGKVNAQWGVLGNFGGSPLVVDGVTFHNSEQLFQMMKFRDAKALRDMHPAKGMTIKMKAKKWQKAGLARKDWGEMIVDAMKFCLSVKHAQCSEFREALEQSRGLFIVEDESGRKKTADTWGTVLDGGNYVGSNLLGRLLMELRDKGKLEYKLPSDALDFVKLLRP